jgi:hypothetical protein
MAATVLPVHVPTNAEASSHLVTSIGNDGTLTVKDATTGQPVTMRLGVIGISGQLTLVAVGPGRHEATIAPEVKAVECLRGPPTSYEGCDHVSAEDDREDPTEEADIGGNPEDEEDDRDDGQGSEDVARDVEHARYLRVSPAVPDDSSVRSFPDSSALSRPCQRSEG